MLQRVSLTSCSVPKAVIVQAVKVDLLINCKKEQVKLEGYREELLMVISYNRIDYSNIEVSKA